MVTQEFKVGMHVRLADPDPAEGDAGVGEVLVAYDYNGDIHVRFPDPTGIGVYRPEELEIVDA